MDPLVLFRFVEKRLVLGRFEAEIVFRRSCLGVVSIFGRFGLCRNLETFEVSGGFMKILMTKSGKQGGAMVGLGWFLGSL